MFWAERILKEIEERFVAKIKSGGSILIRDEKTPSGRVHVGSMRGVAIHGALSELLTEKGIPNIFKYEFNDMDPMDGFPEYLPEEFRQYMGLPLKNIPSPDGKADNFAQYFANEFKQVILASGFAPEFYNVSELYFSGQMDEAIRIALTHASDIRRIYKEVSGSVKPDDWYPLAVICEQCGKVGTTRVYAFDGEKVLYKCEPAMVKWATGCGHEGTVSPFGGKAKFPFKVEWPAKWMVVGVEVEGAGKDHSTKGGARDVAAHIAKEVFKYEAPVDAPYEFLLVGGKKMSSSKGRGSSASEIAALIPAKIFRLALLGKDISQQFNFDPEGDTIPVLYDLYDKLFDGYQTEQHDDYAKLFELVHPGRVLPDAGTFMPRFSQVAFIVQMPHLNLEKEVEALKGSALTSADKAELTERAQYAKKWIEEYAPEKFVFKLQDELPEAARSFTTAQKSALKELLAFIEAKEAMPSGEAVQHKLHEIKESAHIPPAELFGALYVSFLSKSFGPKVGWFLSVLNKDFVVRRLEEVSK